MLREMAILSVGGCEGVVGGGGQLLETAIWPSAIQISGTEVYSEVMCNICCQCSIDL